MSEHYHCDNPDCDSTTSLAYPASGWRRVEKMSISTSFEFSRRVLQFCSARCEITMATPAAKAEARREAEDAELERKI